MADEPDYSDIHIELTDKQASRQLSVGEFIEVMTITHNRMTLQAFATASLAGGSVDECVDALIKSTDLGVEIGRVLKSIAANNWAPRNDD